MALDWLTRKKAREEQRLQYAGRIPPGQELTEKWLVLHYGEVPRFDPKTWRSEERRVGKECRL